MDAEIAQTAGPQLVVPVLNARFLLNAINARWGSLYDALYGTDALDGTPPPAGPYDAERGARVVAWAKAFLDDAVPLAEGSWSELDRRHPRTCRSAAAGRHSGQNYLLINNGLHIEIVIDPQHPIGQTDPASIADIRLEAALSTIVDLEDSVAAVDAADKVAAYRNWLGAMRGDLAAEFSKGGKTLTRKANPDRSYTDMDGETRTPSRAQPAAGAQCRPSDDHPCRAPPRWQRNARRYSRRRDYHRNRAPRQGSTTAAPARSISSSRRCTGRRNAAFSNDLFDAVEDLLELPRHTVKIGVMDEERRTSANLAACIHAVRDRIFFINTGFLDRTGDEIHTSMLAGPMLRKAEIKTAEWIAAYEDRNVQIGLACGFAGRAQIGKGMWAAPDRMAAMLAEKAGHPASGASTAWVPSPTAAVLHATHYHRCNVAQRQRERADEKLIPLGKLLTVPLADDPRWTEAEITEELHNNVQGILGYMVRWIDQGVGCSKVPDIHDVGLMEDRATLRISSQHVANWLMHGIIDRLDVDAALHAMAAKVDAQNADDPAYRPMLANPRTSIALAAARELIIAGASQPSGYTEPVLHRARAQREGTADPLDPQRAK